MEQFIRQSIDYFIHPRLQNQDTPEAIEILKKARVMAGFCIIVAPLLTLSLTVHLIEDQFQDLTVLFPLTAAFCFFLSLAWLKLRGNYQVGLITLLVASYIFLPLRIYSTGGTGSMAGTWAIVIPSLMAILHSKKAGLITLLYLIGVLTLLLPYSLKNPLPSPITGYATIVAIMTIATLVTNMYEREKHVFSKYRCVQKEREILNRMMATLNHEINNPLAIASLTIEKMKRNQDPKDIPVLTRSIERIRNLMIEMNHLSDKQMRLKRYSTEHDLQIYDLQNKAEQ